MVEFLNGHSFFVAKLHEHYGATAVALHATYQFGDSPEYSYGKRERLRRAGLWAVDDHEYYTPPKLLVIKGDLLQGFSMPADYDETVCALISLGNQMSSDKSFARQLKRKFM